MSKQVTVEILLSWTFSEKEWSGNEQHIADMKANPNIILGYDLIDTMYHLNNITKPEVKTITAR